MQPATNSTVRPDLATGVTEFYAGLNKFMGLKLLAPMNVQVKSGTYGKITFAEMNKVASDLNRAPGAEYFKNITKVTNDTFDCLEYGLEEMIDDGNSLVLGQYFDAEMTAARKAAYALVMAQEKRINTLIQSTVTFPAAKQYGVTTEWSTAATCTPVKDVMLAKQKLYNNCGADESMGSKLVLGMSAKVYANLIASTDIKGSLGFNGNGLLGGIQTSAVAQVLGVDEVVFSPVQSAGADLWDDEYAYLFLVSPSIDMSAPRVGNSILWAADCPSNAQVETYRDEAKRSNVIRVRQHVDEKIVNAACGILLTNITA